MMLPTESKRLTQRLSIVLAAAVGLVVVAVAPVAAQPGGGDIGATLESIIPWVIRWALVIGSVIAVLAHIYAGWTTDPDKAYRRKEWRNRAAGGVALAIPFLIVLNWVITEFGGEPIDFLPFV